MAYVSLIPKDENQHDPLGLRPIAVLPVPLPRLGLPQVLPPQRLAGQLDPPRPSWGVRGGEAIAAAVSLAIDQEEAEILGEPWITTLLDYVKYFDTIPWSILWPLARHWGCPEPLLRASSSFYVNLESRFKFGGHLGPQFRRTNSIAQGCPLAMLWANVFGTLWARTMSNKAPNAKIGVFVDDKTITARSRDGWLHAMKITNAFDTAVGHIPNMGKKQGPGQPQC